MNPIESRETVGRLKSAAILLIAGVTASLPLASNDSESTTVRCVDFDNNRMVLPLNVCIGDRNVMKETIYTGGYMGPTGDNAKE